MFGDGKVKVITHDGELYINMWEMSGHLTKSAETLEMAAGKSDISQTMRILVWTLSELALYELGMQTLDEIDNVESLVTLWESAKE
jgi:hypothetical protein